MMRKLSSMMLAATLLLGAVPSAAFAGTAQMTVAMDDSGLESGAAGLVFEYGTKPFAKAKVSKGGVSYTYSLNASEEPGTVWLPLQMGDGEYDIAVYEHVSGTKYRIALSEKVGVKLDRPEDAFLSSTLTLDWQSAVKATAKANELTKGKRTDEEKAKAIYDYIVANVKYDKALARSVTSEYVPDIDGTLTSGQAICYGYATLYAAMLRSAGIPAKLAMGTTKLVNEYHAWNEVYLNGRWVIVDTTVDAGYGKDSKKSTFEKKISDYNATKIY